MKRTALNEPMEIPNLNLCTFPLHSPRMGISVLMKSILTSLVIAAIRLASSSDLSS